MALEAGIRSGLAVRLPDQQAQIHYEANLMRQAKVVAAAKAKMFADDFKYNNAMNAHDNPLVKQFAMNKLMEVGNFLRTNPDWETNPMARAKYNAMIHDLKDNPDLNRGLISDGNFNEWQKDKAEKLKNPDMFDAEAFQEVDNQWKNYLKYGNQFANSPEDAARLGKQAFTYTAPRDFVDLNAKAADYGKNFSDFDVKPLKMGGLTGLGAYEEIPKEESVKAVVDNLYQQNKRQFDKQAAKFGYTSGLEYANKLQRAYIKGKRDMGDWNAAISLQRLNAEKLPPPEGVWRKDIVGKDRGLVNGDVLKEALGAKPPFIITSKNNTVIDMTGREINYTGVTLYLNDEEKRNGIKRAAIQTRIPVDEAVKMGIIQDSPGWFSGDEVAPEWRQKAMIEKIQDKDGNDIDVVTINELMPFDVNTSTSQQIYDQKASPTKFVESPGDVYQKFQYTDDKGEYGWDGKKWVKL